MTADGDEVLLLVGDCVRCGYGGDGATIRDELLVLDGDDVLWCIRSGFPVTISVSRFFLDACKRNPHPKLNALAGIYYLLIIM